MLVTEAYLGSLFLQTLLYGISTATYLECLRALVLNADTYRASTFMRRLLIVVSSLMFIVSLTSGSQLSPFQMTDFDI
jgi:glucose-6-phosphate-specific signal transduction histidine kinase